MKFEIVQSLKETSWRCFLEQQADANIFHSPEFFEVFSRVKGHEPQLWAAVKNEQVFALLTPVHVTLMDGALSKKLTTRSIAYGSILYDHSSEGHTALEQLLQTYASQNKQSALFTEFRNLADLEGVQPILKRCGFVYEDHLNYLIDLNRPPEEVMQSIGQRTRKQIRRGLRQGNVTISEVTDKAQLTEWYLLLQKTYSAAQVPLGDISLFEAAFDVLYPKSMIKLLIATVAEEMIACSAELLFKHIIYGWYSGVDRAFSSYIPNELLMWHLLEWGANHEQYQVYDFGGAGKPDEEYGVRDFKAKFCGKLVNFGRNTYVHQPGLLKISKFGYEIYRKISS